MSDNNNSSSGSITAAAPTTNNGGDRQQREPSEPGQGWSNGSIHPQLFPSTRNGRLQLYSSQRRWIGLQHGWTRIGVGQKEHDHRHSFSQSAGHSLVDGADDPEGEALSVRSLISQLCEKFYERGWATGTGGGVSIRVGGPDENRPWRVFVAPSGIQKEDMIGDDIFELDMNRRVVVPPKTPNLRQSACTPLWYVVFRHRPHVKCVIHTHSIHAQLATMLDPTEATPVLRITHLEMLKGVGNHAYDDVLEIPIIDNRPSEDLLASQLEHVIQQYPDCNAVLVRRHGVYVWGDSWEQAKTQCESFDYLFESAVAMKSMGLDPSVVPMHGTYREYEDDDKEDGPVSKRLRTGAEEAKGFRGMKSVPNQQDCSSNPTPLLPRDSQILLLDIEGVTTSISFVFDVLFPFVRNEIDQFLANRYPEPDRHVTDEDYKTLCAGLAEDVRENLPDAPPMPSEQAGDEKDKIGDSGSDESAVGFYDDAAAMVRALMDKDVKSPHLKQLQGEIWRDGYEKGELKAHVYPDLQPTLTWMHKHEVKIYIYSSGSVQAQKLLFGHSVFGDLRSVISGYFDITTAGNKKQSDSYIHIARELGVNKSGIVFVSDAEAELIAARKAGIGWPIMCIRPGNAKLTPIGKTFPALFSLLQLCGD